MAWSVDKMANLTIDPGVLKKLTCPACAKKDSSPGHSLQLISKLSMLTCIVCKREYSLINEIIDFVGDDTRNISSSQRAMEFRPIISIYERFWRPMVTKPFSSLAWEMETSQQLLELEPNHDLLDVACGTGNFTRLFEKLITKGTITAIDLSLPMLVRYGEETAKSGNNRITLMRVDVTKWPFLPQSFDRIHCSGALHLFPQIQEVFKSIERSLKPGGIFVGATYIKAEGGLKRGFQNRLSDRSGFHWFETKELQNLAGRAGFVNWEYQIKKQGIIFSVKKKL
jgi:ubiquinone/menaquinone biosynthesis C-methylase UbiE